MKILFQGGWRTGRDQPETKALIEDYCKTLGKYIVENNHTIVLTSNRDCNRIIAETVTAVAQVQGRNVKEHLLYYLPERETELPQQGRVRRISDTSWWIEERTYFVQHTDMLIAVGGGRGTFDAIEKALLSHKPVFVASAIPGKAASAWKRRARGYKYLTEGDADILDDINISPDEFFSYTFSVINKMSEIIHSRRIFIVHGHNHHLRDTLADILRKLEFEPVVLQNEASKSLTIIEKLERDTEKIGFAFILYTADDLGRQQGGTENARARQNVIFEHGLLIGLLGRERTCAIVHGGIEIPSDIRGMIYEEIRDLRGEALKIAQILKDAGYRVDASKLL